MNERVVRAQEGTPPEIEWDGTTEYLHIRYLCSYLLHDDDLNWAHNVFSHFEDDRRRRAAEKAKESPFPEGTPERLTWAYNQVLSEDLEALISQNCCCLSGLSRAEYESCLPRRSRRTGAGQCVHKGEH